MGPWPSAAWGRNRNGHSVAVFFVPFLCVCVWTWLIIKSLVQVQTFDVLSWLKPSPSFPPPVVFSLLCKQIAIDRWRWWSEGSCGACVLAASPFLGFMSLWSGSSSGKGKTGVCFYCWGGGWRCLTGAACLRVYLGYGCSTGKLSVSEY